MEPEARPLSEHERAVLYRLAELAPPDEQETLRSYLERAKVGEGCRCGCGSFEIVVDGVSRKEQHYLVAEGFVDRPGRPPLSVMLFAVGLRPDYLELYAPERVDDGAPPIPLPDAKDILP
jgi:hypothetical protein